MVRDPVVAQTVVDRLLERAIGPKFDGPWWFTLTAAWPTALEIELGDNILIDHLEGFGLEGFEGRLGRVMRITYRPQALTSTIEGYILMSEVP